MLIFKYILKTKKINIKLSKLGIIIFGFFNQRFLIEFFYNKYITNVILDLGGQTTKILDRGSIELLGPYGLEKFMISLSKYIANLNTNVLPIYALYILIGFISYLFIPYLIFTNINFSILLLLAILFNNIYRLREREKE